MGFKIESSLLDACALAILSRGDTYGYEITQQMKGLLAQITVRVLGRADSIESMKEEMFKIQEMIEVFSDTGEKLNLAGVDESDFEGTVLTWDE